MKLEWRNTPVPVEIMHSVLKDGAVVKIYRTQDGTWAVSFMAEPVTGISKLSEAQEVGAMLAKRWQGGFVS